MIKAICFDLDGVLTTDKTGSRTTLRYLARETGLPEELLGSEYYKYNKAMLYGEITHRDMWEDFCGAVGQKIAFSVLIDAFCSTPMDREMLALVQELKKTYLIGMITDNKQDRIDEILTWNDLDELFDVVSVSARHHCRKTEKGIFERTLAAFKAAPEECIFIDNTEKNLTVPKQLGMHTIFFDDEKRDMAQLKAALSELTGRDL